MALAGHDPDHIVYLASCCCPSWACGQTNISCENVKGKLVEAGKWPWQVSILFLGANNCSSSLIHHQWVLTAVHCFQRSKDPRSYSVKMGIQRLSENGTDLSVTCIVIHEDFTSLMSQDIALLKLRDSVSWSPLIQPVCLPNPKLKPSLGSMCWMIGWGQTISLSSETPQPSYSLKEVAVKIVNNEICNQQYKFLFLKGQKKLIRNDMICASLQWGMDTCQGNSGSSLVCQVNHTWIQMVLNWSFSSSRHHFLGIYTSTSHFTDWIKTQISDVRFVSRAGPGFLSLVFLTGYILLVSLGSLWLL
ncbi:serine protease 46 [Physeter macrocephalus]|uniref:Serine protease 46 n=1 Tax=Physeter macrocephalus TaxID=9755 RepID=A0A2Y9SUV3_PHYMC|nr:serine protease 46 [Physeter catodon]|eukprot:XP_023979559.1 serine protease 46 [Physeter catodon]